MIDTQYPGGSLWERFQRADNDSDLTEVAGECYGALYWHHAHSMRRGSGIATPECGWWGILEPEECARYRYLMKVCTHRLLYHSVPETNERGNIIIRSHDISENADRYKYDFGECSAENGWQQYDTDQDASYFGIWVHIERREIFSYVEGDTMLVKCPTLESFRAELKSMEDFYGPPPPAFITCDRIEPCDGKLRPVGNVTYYYDERPTV